MKKSIYDALEYIREESITEKEKGTQYERLVRFYLKNDPLWVNRFSDVWMWVDSPTNDGVDIGIDLVAKDLVDGSYWAIQCKCLEDDAVLDYKSVGTFYGKAGSEEKYAHTMIVTSAGQYSRHLNEVAEKWKTVRIFSDDIEESEVDFEPWIKGKNISKRTYFELMRHQREAVDDCKKGFKINDRGQLIMACGTGKTLTSLRLTEELLQEEGKKGGRILYLAPSIALVSQSMRSWAVQSKIPLKCAVVCSDAKASNTNMDVWESSLKDIPYPASTSSEPLFMQMKVADSENNLVVIFSTYQSIQVVSDAQKMGLPDFDLIICDEAHRTTGVTISKNEKDKSEFVKVHDNDIISAKKRLYMTATPRIYGDRAKKKAKYDSFILSSMDDVEIFGPEFHYLSFGSAVNENLLTDYKVIALTMSEETVSEVYQQATGGEQGDFDVTDAARIIGCWKGLLDQGASNNTNGDPDIEGKKLKNAVAFCSTIAESKEMTERFQKTVDAYIDYERQHDMTLPEFRCKIKHVDGSMNAKLRKDKIKWLEDIEEGENASCRILSNARCLAEGVDVPNLDAVLFLRPKKSQIDIIQAVGRVMRKFEGKKYGYIILPIVIPAGMTADEALDNNETYAVVWDVLKALRSHDERLDARINALNYDNNPKGKIGSPVTVASIDEEIDTSWRGVGDKEMVEANRNTSNQIQMSNKQLQEKINALIVKKCGTKVYWDIWAKDIAEIAKRHIKRIEDIIEKEETAKIEFERFLKGLRDSLNNSISKQEAIEMLSQHIITLPVFEALFGGVDFAKSNPISIAMESMLKVLREYTLETEEEQRELKGLYNSVQIRAAGIKTDAGRQAVIKDLYEQFFKEAFKATSEKMGIVYTPNEVVNYILYTTDKLLFNEFGQHLCDPNVNILDAFTGTGTFIVNLINDEKLMPAEKLPYKYYNEIHCNEIMLLAYYIATINIEHAYHNRFKDEEYKEFPGAVLTDTFQMHEEGDPIDQGIFINNTIRVLQQKALPIHVLIGNPPWSIGQKSANDNNKNEEYSTLRARIEETYARKSGANLMRGLYDSYIQAFRWASDRIGEKGIISFVTNGGWIRSSSANGFRECLVEEFNSIYVFDLRGNQRTKGEESRKEGGKIFGSGSRAPVAITFLIKNPHSKEKGAIFYHNIGDYLSREEKLAIISKTYKEDLFEWRQLHQDEYGDWLDKKDSSFTNYAPLAIKKRTAPFGIFNNYFAGVVTSRDAWLWNYSSEKLNDNVKRMIKTYNEELNVIKNEKNDDLISDPTKISWSRGLKQKLTSKEKLVFSKHRNRTALYRPFCKQILHWYTPLIESPGKNDLLFPKNSTNNKVIIVHGKSNSGFSCMIADMMVDFNMMSAGAQCFPLYWYNSKNGNEELVEGISDNALSVFRNVYPNIYHDRLKKHGGSSINKEDVFYYIYGILHSPEYRSRFESNLKKELPRIPLSENFKFFVAQGKYLADLHLNYEEIEPYPLTAIGDEQNPGHVKKMRWSKKLDKETGKRVDDKSKLIFNEKLMFTGIPEEAHRYYVNGRTPLEWIMDRYQIKTDKKSGIVNDPNEYSDDPQYIPNLIKRLVTVSVKTMEVIDSMMPIAEIEQPVDWPDDWSI